MLKEKILILLKRQKKTQKELCASIGISDTGLRKILARDSCETSLLKKIARVLDVPIAYFFDESGGSAVATGDFSAASVNGDASVSTDCQAVLKEKVKALELLIGEKDKMIEEKERTIKILLQK